MEAVAEGQQLPAGLRERLEHDLAEAGQRVGFDTTIGNVRVTIALENGKVRWVEPILVRAPASRLDEPTAHAAPRPAAVSDLSE